MTRSATAPRSPAIDLLKAVATQLIVWHHLVLYGPLSDLASALMPEAAGWLRDRPRLVVQVFLVVAGFLAAQGLVDRLGCQPGQPPQPWQPGRLLWRRFLRLAKPYWVALVLALLGAALARALMDHPSTPAAPTLDQVAAHALMLQDVLGHPALSAGVWYVAIDLQLYALFVALATLSVVLARATGWRVGHWQALLCLLPMLWSMYELNLDPSLDSWGPYFFGAYGLGVLAHHVGQRRRRAPWLVALGVVVCGALMHGWRDRLVVAGLTALVLALWGARVRLAGLPQRLGERWLPFLADRSYALFLVHYPVCLVINALVTWLWPDRLVLNVVGLLAAWLLSNVAADLLYRAVEGPARRAPLPRIGAAHGRARPDNVMARRR